MVEFPYLHVGARYYDPVSGRFLQRDPIGIRGGLNVFAYVNNNPIAFEDSTGMGPIGAIIQALRGLGDLSEGDWFGATGHALSCLGNLLPPLTGGIPLRILGAAINGLDAVNSTSPPGPPPSAPPDVINWPRNAPCPPHPVSPNNCPCNPGLGCQKDPGGNTNCPHHPRYPRK